ncbi:MAG TPA: ABC transporter ATP-binding protein, partial [Saprospirales bacterium]|nr:ABC transporter ATP-binding protein [Saprospirales bacterium]
QRCDKQVAEAILIHNKVSKIETRAQVIALFEKVLLPDPERIYRSYPHEMSGGQIQRVMIAMA